MAVGVDWRCRVYESDGTTVMTAVGGSELFQMATRQGVSGYQPYLQGLSGLTDRFDPVSKYPEVGELYCSFADVRTGGVTDNLTRYVSKFWGDSSGRPDWGGHRIEFDLSLDQGATWTLTYTCVIYNVRLEGRVVLGLLVRDVSDDFDVDLFVDTPRLSYAVRPSILPCNLVQGQAYGGRFWVHRLRGKWVTPAAFGVGAVLVDMAHIGRPDNVFTKDLQKRERSGAWSIFSSSLGPETLRAKLSYYPSGASGSFRVSLIPGEGEGMVLARAAQVDELGLIHPTWIVLANLPNTSDPDYLDGSTIPNNQEVWLHVEPSGPATSRAPILINDIHAATLWKNVLEGKLGRLDENGDPVKAFDFDASAFSSLIADLTIPKIRYFGDRVWDMNSFIVEVICRHANLSYRLDESGAVLPTDLRFPNSVPSMTTLTNNDLTEGDQPEWEFDRHQAIGGVDLVYYRDDVAQIPDNNWTGVPDAIAGLFSEPLEQRLTFLDFGDPDTVETLAEYDFPGVRYLEGEVTAAGGSRHLDLQRRLLNTAYEMRQPFGRGASVARLPLRPGAGKPRYPGEFVLLDIDEIPNPTTHQRGGLRMYRVLGKELRGPRGYWLEVLDQGINTQAGVPSLGTATQRTGDTSHGVTVTVTLNAQSDPVNLWYAITDTSVGTRPVDGSDLWVLAQSELTTSSSVDIYQLPSGKRIWLRARSVSTPRSGVFQLPSAWVYSGGTGYVDLDALGTPTGLAESNITGLSAKLTWTNAETDKLVQLLITTPDTADLTEDDIQITLPEGTERYTILVLDQATSYKWGVRYLDGALGGGVGPTATSTFTTTSSNSQAPEPYGIAVTGEDVEFVGNNA